MELKQEIDKANHWINESNNLIVGLPIPPTETDRISISLLHLSLEHCMGVVSLIEQNILGSALALLRPQFEAYVNGVWIKWCANEKQIGLYKKGETPYFQVRVDAIEKLDGYALKALSKIKKENWDIFCDFTHGGFHQVRLRNTKDGISYNFPPGYIENAVTSSVAFSLSAGVALAKIIDNDELANNLFKLHQEIYKVEMPESS